MKEKNIILTARIVSMVLTPFSTQMGINTRQQFLHTKRLANIIICSITKPRDNICFL